MGIYKNPAETKFSRFVKGYGWEIFRKGYPDFMVLRGGDIVGFVEVKPNHKKKNRKPSQERFRRFCEKYGIPFAYWAPGDDLPWS